MRIAVIGPGRLPLPAKMGGAVETLTDMFIAAELGNVHQLFVYSSSPRISKMIEFRDQNIVYRQFPWKEKKRNLLYKVKTFCDDNYEFNGYLSSVIRSLKHDHIDCILVENRPLFVKRLKKEFNVPVFLHMHNDPFPTYRKKCPDLSIYCDKVLAVSEYIKNCVQKHFPKAKISVVYNGVDLHFFTNESDMDEKSQIRQNYGIDPRETVLCYVGRFVPEKGVLELIQAYSMLPKQNISLLIIGSSWFSTSQKSGYILKAEEAAKKCKNGIIFTGFIEHDKLPTIESACDIAVLPSKGEEAFGLTVVEAMACGLAVITTKSGGIPEIVDDSTGILLENDNDLVGNLENAMADLISHPAKRKKLQQAAAKKVHKFSLDNYVKNMNTELGLMKNN